MNHGFFLFRFLCSSDLDHVLREGPWVFDDATLALEA